MGTEGLKECELKGSIFHSGVFYFVFELQINMCLENPPVSFPCQIKLCSLEVTVHTGVVTWHQSSGRLWIQPGLWKPNKKEITHTLRDTLAHTQKYLARCEVFWLPESGNTLENKVHFISRTVFSASKLGITYLKTNVLMRFFPQWMNLSGH